MQVLPSSRSCLRVSFVVRDVCSLVSRRRSALCRSSFPLSLVLLIVLVGQAISTESRLHCRRTLVLACQSLSHSNKSNCLTKEILVRLASARTPVPITITITITSPPISSATVITTSSGRIISTSSTTSPIICIHRRMPSAVIPPALAPPVVVVITVIAVFPTTPVAALLILLCIPTFAHLLCSQTCQCAASCGDQCLPWYLALAPAAVAAVVPTLARRPASRVVAIDAASALPGLGSCARDCAICSCACNCANTDVRCSTDPGLASRSAALGAVGFFHAWLDNIFVCSCQSRGASDGSDDVAFSGSFGRARWRGSIGASTIVVIATAQFGGGGGTLVGIV